MNALNRLGTRLLVTLFLALLAILNSRAQGLIWSTDRWAEQSETPGASWQIAFDHTPDQHSDPWPSLNPSTGIFSMFLNTNDSGHTFFASTLNEPGFGRFVAGLTDGTNGYLRFEVVSFGILYNPSEQTFLGRSSLSPDLAGYNITQIGFRVNNFYDWYEPVEERNFRTLNYSLDFYGAAFWLLRKKARRR